MKEKNNIKMGKCRICKKKCEMLQHYSVYGLCLKCIKKHVPKMKPLVSFL